MSTNGEEDPMDLGEEEIGEDDLFGDDDGEEEVIEKVRALDDQDLDSGDDEMRHDRDPDRMDDVDSDPGTAQHNVLYQNISRHQIPKPSDGEVSISLSPEIHYY